MDKQCYKIFTSKGDAVNIDLQRDRRLHRTSRWERLPDGTIIVRVPYRLPKHQIKVLLEQVTNQLEKGIQLRARRTDADLQERAELLNKRYFDGKIHWNAIRWVGNMQMRLGSCTRGGTTDGEIRISDKIREWPGWVIDYVILHELLHRLYPNHSKAFRAELRSTYPLYEKAVGFIQGVNFATGRCFDEDENETEN